MGARGFGVSTSMLAALIVSLPAAAADSPHVICPLVLQQERVNREERELAVEIAEARLAAEESIFSLVDQLWNNDAVERIVYLTSKHVRDVAEIEVKRRQLLLKRQEAEVEQLEITCSSQGSSADFESAHRRYLQADCHRIGKELAIAELDLAFLSEFLASVQDLRKHGVATAQDVIRAERDVEMARKRVERHGPRVQECVSSGAAAGVDQKKAAP